MRTTILIALLTAVNLALVACSTVPAKSELTRLDRSEVTSVLVGNSYSHYADYGRWAGYIESPTKGYGRASGSWGSQSATAEHEIATNGEWCTVYSGNHEWSTPDNEYCSVYYTDKEGTLYSETTKNTDKPQREGSIRKVVVKPGDEYGLKN